MDEQRAIEDNEALSRAEKRLRDGTVAMREAPARDMVAIIRAGLMWREIAMAAMNDMQTRQIDAMSIGEPE